MKKSNLYTLSFILGLFCCFTNTYSQEPSFSRFTANDSVKIISTQNFSGNALWGYMNGGADLYLEFGFVSLEVQEIEWKGVPLKAEIFRMQGEQQSYGILSINGGEKIRKTSFGYTSENPYQFQAAVGEWYISIVNATGSAIHAAATIEAGQFYGQKSGHQPLIMPEIPAAGKSFGPVLHARGMLGMRNACPEINPLFRELEGYNLWLRVDHKTRDIVGRLEAPVGLMNYLQVKARVMDTPLGDVYVTEFNRLNDDTALFKCQYRDRSKDAEGK